MIVQCCLITVLLVVLITSLIIAVRSNRSAPVYAPPIPKIIFLTYKTREAVPQAKIDALQRLNPAHAIRVYGDAECRAFLKTEWSDAHAEFFDSIPDGPIKADFWRACAIFTYGGGYLDLDVDLLMPLDAFIQPGVSLCTSGSLHRNRVNPILLAATPGSPILDECIRTMLSMRTQPYTYWGYSICPHMYNALTNFIFNFKNKRDKCGVHIARNDSLVQMLRESSDQNHTFWKQHTVMRNHTPEVYDNNTHTLRS